MGPQLLPPAGPGERPPEVLPQVQPAAFENMPKNLPERSPEVLSNPESYKNEKDLTSSAAAAVAAASAADPLGVAPVQVAPADSTSNDNPLVAEDSDLIEKEWVNKSKDIQKKYRNDPHQQRSQVSALNADYLNKRFGVQVKLPQE